MDLLDHCDKLTTDNKTHQNQAKFRYVLHQVCCVSKFCALSKLITQMIKKITVSVLLGFGWRPKILFAFSANLIHGLS